MARLGRSLFRLKRIASSVVVGALLALAVALLGFGGHAAHAEGAQAGRAQAGSAQTTVVASRAAPAVSVERSSSDHVVVRLAPGAALPDLSSLGLQRSERVGSHGAYVLDVASPTDKVEAAAALEELRHAPGVLSAEPGAVRSACLLPNDPFYSVASSSHGQWSLPRIGMPEAWDMETGSSDVVVAILDTGIDKDLADFEGRIVSPYSALDQSTDWPSWRDNTGHGTAVAGVAVAQGNDAQGMAGVVWNVKIMPVKIAGYGDTYDYTLADGIYWAVDHGADVISISFAGDVVTEVEEAAVNYALAHDAIVVAAAGNKAWKGIYFPAALPGVIAVGATEESPTNSRASFSATGAELDLVAPGTDIWSHSVGAGAWAWWSGTSFSTPMVSGVCALLRSADPDITVAEVTEILSETADDLGPPGWDQEFGWGIVDAGKAVARVSGAVTTTTTEVTTTTTAPPTTTTEVTTTTTAPPSTTTTTAPRFADVPVDTPYSAEIDRLAALGIVEGAEDGLFHPLETLKRQQFAKMIVLTLGYPVSEGDLSPFTDVVHVPGQPYPYHYVAVAYHYGITEGTEPSRFSPYGWLTRAQMITMVVRAAQLQEPPAGYSPPFPNFSPVHYPFARKAAGAGLLDGLLGMGPDYGFMASASRGEACALLEELLQ
jgi:thermitase